MKMTPSTQQHVICSIDDYDTRNVRAAHLLKEYGIQAIFFIELNPQQMRGSQQDAIDQIKWLHEQGFTIGGHTMTHPQDLKGLTDERLQWEITESKRMIEEVIGEEITQFAYTRGRHNERVRSVVSEAGFTHARTTKIGDAFNYDDPLQIPCSAHIYNGRPEYLNTRWDIEAKKIWDTGNSLHLFFHSWEVHRTNQWVSLIQLLKYTQQ